MSVEYHIRHHWDHLEKQNPERDMKLRRQNFWFPSSKDFDSFESLFEK